METTLNIVTTVVIEVKRGIPCKRHAGLGCDLNCRRCLTAEQSTKVLRRLLAGYWRKPELETIKIEVT